MVRVRIPWAGLVGLVGIACSSSDGTGIVRLAHADAGQEQDAAGASRACQPGDTRECVGSGACRGGQTCLSDGSGFGACDCGGGSGGAASGGGGSGGTPLGAGGIIGLGGMPGVGGATGLGGAIGLGGSPGAGGGLQGCQGQSVPAKPPPMDLYLMQDQSNSMADVVPSTSMTYWQALTSGLTQFFDASSATGTGVGIQYFPLGGVAPASCTASYSVADVEIAALPGNRNALVQSLSSHGPSGFTPTGPALSGAITHMKTWAATHPDRTPAVVLLTDGFPTECSPQDLAGIAGVAASGLSAFPPVLTFVVGIDGGIGLQNLDEIALAGGTKHAVIVTGQGVAGGVSDALATVVGSFAACSLSLPAGPVSTQQVNVWLHPAGAATEHVVPRVTGSGDCDLQPDGWFYDNPSAPKAIDLCPQTCATAGAVGASLRLELGCATVIGSAG